LGIGLPETDATVTQALTGKGQIVGTLQYMSPEQMQGLDADARSDIFSFGLVLYEMLTGVRAFEAASGATLIAAVLKEEPRPLRELQPGMPLSLDRILKVCLAKDPEDRWQSARDLRHELAWVAPDAPLKTAAPTRRLWPILAAAVVAALGVGYSASRWFNRPVGDSAEVLPLTTLAGIEAAPALSPDGKLVAFTWTGADFGAPKICVKQLDSGEPLVLSRAAQSHGSPTWSPDGRQVAYLRSGDSGAELLIVSALGGPERRVGAPWRGDVDGGLAWLPVANQIVGSAKALVAFSAESGVATPWTKPPKDRSDGYPALSPDGATLAFVRAEAVVASTPAEILSLHLDARQQPQGDPKVLTSRLHGVRGLAWAPDGRSLVVSAESKAANHLFRVLFPGGASTLLGGAGAALAGGGLSISPATHRMALAQAQSDVDIFRVAGPAWPSGGP
jgi:hypothetical protein